VSPEEERLAAGYRTRVHIAEPPVDLVQCDYHGYEFGAAYPDSVCIRGRLYDADNCDDGGNLYEPVDHVRGQSMTAITKGAVN
jgi:hypothetical protein